MKFNFTIIKTLILGLVISLFTNLHANEVIIGNSTGSSTTAIPANGYYNNGWSSMIFSMSEIGGPCTISGLQFQMSNSVNYTLYTQKVYMMMTTDSIFTSSAYINPSSVGATQVYSGNVSWTNAGGFQGITLQTPFNYTSGNLLILWENRDGSYSSGYPTWYYTSTSNVKAKYKYTDSSFPTGSGSMVTYRPNTKLIYTPSYSNDLALTQWVFPVTGTSASSSMPISVKVSNVGGQAQSNFVVKYSINNGVSWSQQTVTSTLNPGVSTNLTFITPANMATPGVYQCIAVVKNTGDTIPQNDTLRKNITICGGGYSGSYTVGSGSSDDFPDLNTAFAALKSCGMGSSVSLKVKPGTYSGNIAIPYISGLSATKTLTVETNTGLKDVIFTHNGVSTNNLENYTLSLDSARFVKLKNLTIKASGSLGSYALLVDKASNNIIENCVIEGENSSTSTGTQFSTIYINYITGSYARQNKFINNIIKYGSYSIYGTGTSGQVYGDQIIGNQLLDYRNGAIYLTYNDSLKIQNNEIRSSAQNTIGISLNRCENDLDISANKIESNNNYGIYLYYCQSTSSNPNRIYNNWIYGSPVTTSNSYLIYNYRSDNTFFEHNSIFITNSNSVSATTYGLYSYYGSGITIRNNSFVNEASGYAFYVYNTSMTSFDYNNFYSSGSYLAYYNGNRTNLAAVKSYNSTNLNSVSTTGVYYSADNLHSNSSGLNNIATSASAVAYDIDGQPRSTTTPDIGADEFDILSYDGGLLGFTGLTNQCSGTQIPIMVSFQNFGSQAITSANITASIGTTLIHQAWSGYLSPGSSTNIFLGLRTFSSDTVYNFTAYIDSVNHVADLNDFNDTTKFFGYRTSLNGNFVIGSGANADFATILDAVNALNQYGVCGPVVFNIQNGTYTGNYSIINGVTGMSNVNTVTFRSLTGDTSDVILTHNSSSTSDNYIFNLDNSSYFKFIGLTLKSTNSSYNTIFRFYQGSDFTVDSCLLLMPYGNLSSYGNAIDANYSNHVNVSNSNIVNASYGVYFIGSSSSYANGLTLNYNKFQGIGLYGIYINYADTIIISGNTINNYQSNSQVRGIYTSQTNYYLDINNNNINIQSDNASYGVYLYYANYNSSSSSAQIKVYNNFIRTNSTNSSYSYGLYMNRGYYHKYYFNTVKTEGSNTGNYASYFYYPYNSTFLNNIFYCESGYSFYRYSGSTISSDYNNFYTGGTYLMRYSSSSYTTLSQYVSYVGTNSHSKSVDPGFVSATDLHIFSQSLNDAGTPYGGVTTDIDGETRSLYLPDIGADEYSLLSRDVLPYAVNSPANPAAIGQNPVRVAIKNQGTSTLYAAKIFYRLDGTTTDSIYWVGNLGFLGVDSLINMGNVTLSSGSHTLEVWTKNPNGQTDLNPNNDTLVYQFNAIPKPILDYSPSIVIDTINSCNSTASKSIKIYNRGSVNLTVNIASNTAGSDSVKILSILTGYYSTYYSNAKSSILTNVPKVHITETSTYSATVLSSLLVGKDVVLIPRITSTTSTTLNAYTAFGPVLQTFVNNGGSVIFLGSQGTSANAIFNTGLFSGSYNGYLSTGYSLTLNQPNHDIFDGITNTYITTAYYCAYYTLTTPGITTLANYSGYPVISERSMGAGKALILGFDYYYTNSDLTAILTNTINYAAHHGDFVVNNAFNQTVTPGDSTTFSFSFSSLGLTNGWHTDNFNIVHNDQSQSTIEVPCSLYVAGTPEISFSETFHSFGSVFTGVSITDSIYFYNTGCDNLYITGVSSNNSYLTPLKINDTIVPGDSASFSFKFQPAAVGSYVMSVTVYNNDSNQVLTFAGSATPSPAISFNPNPVNVTITDCGDSTIVPIVINNTGGAVLTGTVSAPSDSLEVLMLTYGAYSSGVTYLTDALDYTFTKFNLTQSSISSATQLQSAITDMDVLVIPYINSSSYSSIYSSFSTILQNFVSNGGILLYAGQYYSTYLTSAGFFSGTYMGYDDYTTVTVNTNHPITTGLSASTYIGNEDFLYYNMTNTNRTDLINFNGYTVSSISPYGDGYAVYLGFYYIGYSTHYSYNVASNSLQFAYDKKSRWIDFSTYNFTINPSSSSTLNVKFKSADLATGQYSTNLNISTNIPNNSNVQLPCTLTVKNELDATSFLGPDTSYCGPKLLDAGSGYSSYLWNTAATSQTLTANTTGYYMVTVSDGSVCSSRDTVLITINPMPNAVITGLPTAACTNGGGIQMSGSPSGGGFIGNGVSGSTFYPANVSTGPHNVTYTYTNSYGCTDTDVKSVTVYNPPTVLLSGLASTYCPQGSISTLIGAPSGGVFSGNGVVGNQFNPAGASSGSQSVIYTYTDIHGCSNSDTATTTINSYVQANITGYQPDHCINDTAVTLNSNIAGTTFNGPGVSGNVFTPANAGVGSHNIYYAYSSNGCSYQDTIFITVHALPTGVSISGIGNGYCYDEGNISMSGFPLGGVFSGPGVSGTTFNTMNAGAGNHVIKYTYTDVYGCSASETEYVTVNALPVITFTNLNPSYCIDNGLVPLTATPVGGAFSGNYVTGSNFNPSTAGVGSHYVHYAFTDANSCSSADSIMITVNPLPVASFTGLPQNICSNAAPLTLIGSPLGGTFSGSGMTGPIFDPSSAGAGYKQITYSYTDNNGCSDQAQTTVQVLQTQSVDLGATQTISANSTTQFNPVISGGTGLFTYSWSPANKVVNPAILNPSTVPLTQTTLFSLTVSDNTSGCIASDSALVQVTGGAIGVTINASQTNICEGQNVTLQAFGSGGNGNYTYSWSSVPAGFTATTAIVNINPVVTTTYSCLVSDGNLNSTQTVAITVKAKPVAQITNLSNSYCSNQAIISLQATPSGGSFSGNGVNNNNFNPALASIGTNLVTYSVTAANGCSDVDTVLVDVKSAPTAYAGLDTILPCQNNGIQLGQQPFSGVSYSWYPSFGLTDPLIANPISNPNYGITYIFTATAINGCTATDTINISVIGGPNAIVSNDTMICAGEVVNLNVSGGDSYLWSTGDTIASIQVAPMVTTQYFVVASQSNCADLDTITVTVNSPKPHLGKDTIVCAGNSILITPGIFPSYIWSTGSTSPFITVDSTDIGIGSTSITVEVTDNFGCSNTDTIIVEFKNCTGFGYGGADDLTFSLYPNPTNGKITLTSTITEIRKLNYSIVDVAGSLIKNGVMENNTGFFSQTLDLSTLAKGVYMIHLVGNDNSVTLRITIQ